MSVLESCMSHTSHVPSLSCQTPVLVRSPQAVEIMARVQMSEGNLSANSTLSVNPWEEEIRQREESDRIEELERRRGMEEKEQEEPIRRSQPTIPLKRTVSSTNNEPNPQPRKGIALIFAPVDKEIDLLRNQLSNVHAEFMRVHDVVADVRSTVFNLNKPEAIKLVDADAFTNYQRIANRLNSIAYYISVIAPYNGSSVDVASMTPKIIQGSDDDDVQSEVTGVPVFPEAPSPPASDEVSHHEFPVYASSKNRSAASSSTSIMDRKPRRRRRRSQVGSESDSSSYLSNDFAIQFSKNLKPRPDPKFEQEKVRDSDSEQPELTSGSRRLNQNRSSYGERMRAPRPRQPRREYYKKRQKEQRGSVDTQPKNSRSNKVTKSSREFVWDKAAELSDHEDYLPHPYPEDIGHHVKARQRSRRGHQLPPSSLPSPGRSSSERPPSARLSRNQSPSVSEANSFRSRENLIQEELQNPLEPRIVLVEPRHEQVSSLETILQEKQNLLLEMLDDVQTRLDIIHTRQTSNLREDKTDVDGRNSKGNLWNRLKSKVIDRRKTEGELENGVET